MLAILWVFRRRNPRRVSRGFRHAQTASAAAMALGHGLQDAQKTMGVIVLALIAGGYHDAGDDIPLWVDLRRRHGDLARHVRGWLADHADPRPADHRARPAARVRGRDDRGVVLYATAFVFAAPISTTHTITSSIMGVGATRGCPRSAGGSPATSWPPGS